jgi:hypothetical protein
MRTHLIRSRFSKREHARLENIEAIKARLGDFGSPDANPVRAQIADLRSLRDAGQLSDAEFASTVAAVLGAIEAADEASLPSRLDSAVNH